MIVTILWRCHGASEEEEGEQPVCLSLPLWSEGPALCSTVFFSAAGKREGRSSLVAACTDNDDRLLFIEDSALGRRFLVDSGAQRSIMSPSTADALGHGQEPPLDASNGTPIRTFGTRFMTVCFDGREFSWKFVVYFSTHSRRRFFMCLQAVSGCI